MTSKGNATLTNMPMHGQHHRLLQEEHIDRKEEHIITHLDEGLATERTYRGNGTCNSGPSSKNPVHGEEHI